LRFVLTKLQ